MRSELLGMARAFGVNDAIDNIHMLGDDYHGVGASGSCCCYPRICGCCAFGPSGSRGQRRYPKCCACLCYGVLGRIDVIYTRDEPNHMNAVVGACGHTILTRSLVKRLSDDQLRAIWAHEMAHVKWAHPRRTGTIAALVVVILFTLSMVSSFALYAWIYRRPVDDDYDWRVKRQHKYEAMLMSLRCTPFVVGLSLVIITILLRWRQRQHEYDADAFSVSMTAGDATSLVTKIAFPLSLHGFICFFFPPPPPSMIV
jgi:hypothetical protein